MYEMRPICIERTQKQWIYYYNNAASRSWL